MALTKYIAGEADYEYMHAPIHFEKWIQESATEIETSMT